MNALANMNTTVLVALIGAIVTLGSAIGSGITRFSLNKATATKISTDSTQVEASTAEIFSRLSAEWATRADQRVEQLDLKITQLIDTMQELVVAVDNIAPILERSMPHADPSDLSNVIALSAAARKARRLAI